MENKENKSIVNKIVDDIKAGASAQHEIDKANFATVKANSKARHDALTAPNPDFEEFKEAKGLKGKVAVLAEHAERDAKEIRTGQRVQINDLTKKNYTNLI